MNGYKAFYKGKELEVYAESSYQAQLKASKLFKAKKAIMLMSFFAKKKAK